MNLLSVKENLVMNADAISSISTSIILMLHCAKQSSRLLSSSFSLNVLFCLGLNWYWINASNGYRLYVYRMWIEKRKDDIATSFYCISFLFFSVQNILVMDIIGFFIECLQKYIGLFTWHGKSVYNGHLRGSKSYLASTLINCSHTNRWN